MISVSRKALTFTLHVVIIDLLIRLGFITPDNEPDFMKIMTRIHGTFDYEKW
jgi:hypothetical protein